MKQRTFISKTLIVELLLLLLIRTSTLQSQPIKGSWTSIADLPTSRWFPGTSVCDGKIYVFGGNQDASSAPLDIVEVYDPSAGSWATCTSMPAARSQLSSCEVDGKIYIIGGSSGPTAWAPVADVYIYDPSSDTWSGGTDMPNPRTELTLVAAQGKIYAFGGIDGNSTGTRYVDIYDPSSDTWSTGADMPTARGTMPAVYLNGKIYVFGGTNGGASGWNHYATLEVYDIAANTWETKTEMPFSRSHLSGCLLNNKIYALGGSQVNAGVTYADVASYNTISDSWESEPPMLIEREAFHAVVVDGKIYAIGGTQMQLDLVAFSNSEVYDTVPRVFISSDELRLPTQQSGLIGKLNVPNSGTLEFTYQLTEDQYADSLFNIRNDSLVAAVDFELTADKQYTVEVLAVSDNSDSVKTVIPLSSVFKVETVYTAPMGFLLTSSDKKVMIDVLSAKTPCYGFITNTDTIYENIKNGVEPFNNVDIIYTSHSHCCHFSSELLLNAMINNPEAISIMNTDVRNLMNTYFTANPTLLDRVYVPDLAVEEYKDTTIAGVEMRLTKIEHEGSSTLCINLMLDSIRFTNFDDYNDLAADDYETIGFTQVPTDVAFLGSGMLSRQDILTNTYNNSALLTFSHINGYTPALHNTLLTNSEELNTLGYQTNILVWPMQIYSYKKKDNKMWAGTLNGAPQLNRSFGEVNVVVNNTVEVGIPVSSFKDSDAEDVLTYTFLINSQPLSSYDWASFDEARHRLILTPAEARNYTITIIATDTHLSFARTTFLLRVNEVVGFDNPGSDTKFNVYPNPAQSVITVGAPADLSNHYSVRLLNVLGETLFSAYEQKCTTSAIDLSGYSDSILFLIITIDGENECHKIIKN